MHISATFMHFCDRKPLRGCSWFLVLRSLLAAARLSLIAHRLRMRSQPQGGELTPPQSPRRKSAVQSLRHERRIATVAVSRGFQPTECGL